MVRVVALTLLRISTSPQELSLAALVYCHLLNCIVFVGATIQTFDAAMLEFSLKNSQLREYCILILL